MLFQYKKVIGKARPLTHGLLDLTPNTREPEQALLLVPTLVVALSYQCHTFNVFHVFLNIVLDRIETV